MTEADLERIRAFADVKGVKGLEDAQPAYIQGSGSRYLLQTQALVEGQRIDLVDGAPPQSPRLPEIAITTEYREPLGCASDSGCVGTQIELGVRTPAGTISTVTATVSAVINDSLIGAGRLWINDALQQRLTALATPEPERGTYLGAVVYSNSTDAAVLDSIKKSLKDNGFTGETIQDQIGVVSNILTLASLVLAGFGAIALVAASFGVVNTLYMAVQDRTREIGLMKAHSLSSRRIFGLFSIEALLLGLCGAALGIGAAALLGFGVNVLTANTVLKKFPGFQILDYPAWVVIGVAALILLITFLAGTLPARRAAKLDAIEALRYE